tara:strand:- start:1910 stop:3922 length:2013 start_codon:yes stop_codon:yes gene_type:complete
MSIIKAMGMGFLEEYNNEMRKDADFERLLEIENQKARIQDLVDGKKNRYFTVKDSLGQDIPLFALNDPSKWTENQLLTEDMKTIGSTLTEDYMNELEDIDPTLAHNVRNSVGNWIQRSFVDRTVRVGKDKDQKEYPLASNYGLWYNHPYFGGMFRQIYKNGVIPKELLENENIILTAENKNGEVVPKVTEVNSNLYGYMFNKQTGEMEPVTKANLDVWASEMNEMKGVNYPSEKYDTMYTAKGIQLFNTPLNDQNQNALRNYFPHANENAPLTLGMLTNKIVQQAAPDRVLSDTLYYTIQEINEKVEEKEQITLDDIYNMFKLAAPNQTYEEDLISRKDMPEGANFMEKYFKHIDLEKLMIRRDASQNVIDTTQYILDDIDNYEDQAGVYAPIGRAATWISGLVAGFFGDEANVPQQVIGLVSGYKDKYDLDTAKGVQAKLTMYAKDMNKTGMSEAAALGARHRFYKYMLAYQLAVAIQGGTGGRTVSDQDVENMLNAIGDSLFANGRVQMNVLQTIQNFAKDIHQKNQYWLNVTQPTAMGGGPEAAYAAQAMDKFMYNTKVMDVDASATRTRIAGDRLQKAINNSDLLPAEGIPDRAFSASERSGGVYTPDLLGFTDHMLDFKDAGITLDYEKYINVVDIYTSRNSGMQVLRNEESYRSIVLGETTGGQ